jgi:hypothetical protein
LKKLNQLGVIDHILYIGAVLIAAIMFVAMYFYWQNSQNIVLSPKPTEVVDSRKQTNFEVPNDWLTFQNKTLDYTFAYPQEWGSVQATKNTNEAGSVIEHIYTFSKNERVTLRQKSALADEVEFAGDFAVFNDFSVMDSSVKLCTNRVCRMPHMIATADARMFSNKNGRDGFDFLEVVGSEVYYRALIGTGIEEYPGLNVEAIFDKVEPKTKDTAKIIQDIQTYKYNELGDLRTFVDVLR